MLYNPITHPGWFGGHRQLSSWKLKEVLSLPKRLDLTQTEPITTHYNGTTIKILPPQKGTRRAFKHRIMAECPYCHSFIPAGRMHQHLNRKDHNQ